MFRAWQAPWSNANDQGKRVFPQHRPRAPAPRAPRFLPREVSQAINRKAHALSLQAFEKNREYLEQYVRKYPDDPRQQLDCVQALDLDDSQHVLVGTQTLWGLCATLSILEVLADTVKARIAPGEGYRAAVAWEG